MDTQYYNLDDINFEITELACKQGEFQADNGNTIPYKTHTLKLKINDYPMEFKFKLDKVFNEYIGDAIKGE